MIQDALVEMYSYSALSNLLVLKLSHHQCTCTRTLLVKMYPRSDLGIYICQNVTSAISQTISLICLDHFVNVVYHHQCSPF